LAACSQYSAEREYLLVWKTYLRGELAVAAAEAGAHGARHDPLSTAHWKFRLLQAEALTGLARNDEAAALLADPVPAGRGLEQEEARRLIDLASLRQGRTGEANGYLSQARAIVKDPELQIRIHLVQGQVGIRSQDIALADREFQAGLDAAIRLGRTDWQALALNNLCYIRKTQGRYEQAIESCTRSIQLAEASGALRTAVFAHNNVGSVYAYLGDFPAAFEHQEKSVAMSRAMGAKTSVMTGLGELGLTHYRNSEAEKAIPYYQQAYDLAIELKAPRDAARHAENMALVLIDSKEWDRADEWNRRATTAGPAPASIPYLTRNRAQIALGRGDPAEAARAARELFAIKDTNKHLQSEAWALLGQVEAAAKRYPQANAHFQRAREILEDTRSGIANAQNRVTLLSRLIWFYREYVELAVRQNDDLLALRAAESSRARVLAERLDRDFKADRLADAAALRAFARASKVSLLSFWVAPKRSFAWLVGPTGVRRFDLPPAPELEALVTAHREVVEHSIVDPLTDAAPRALWDKLLAPIAAEIPKGARVIVIPDGPLHRVNLETLVAPGPAPHYWLEDVELAVSPSISIAMAKAGAPLQDGTLLAIGAPDYAGSKYEPLPGAAAEVQQLRARFAKASAITGAQATPAAYRAAGPEKFSAIHFAAHAEANVEKPLESAVVLSRSGDGFKLHARDVIDVPIRADLVTLSACRSAGARAYAGEGLMGFAWAFLHAGARAVVAGLWEVSDNSTGPLMAKFYEGVAAGRGTACSLREAKLSLLREGRYGKAFYWRPFQTYVAGGY
jgi:CHAT domain-containing protein/tetratricopeptide (TPR) repeat protein